MYIESFQMGLVTPVAPTIFFFVVRGRIRVFVRV